ncbi:MAG TPA: Holliday junction resolvase, partial [Anaeromyxobacter sp.]|nr:Holliday junction resolvase [Anaeromyxobacter sp.]
AVCHLARRLLAAPAGPARRAGASAAGRLRPARREHRSAP